MLIDYVYAWTVGECSAATNLTKDQSWALVCPSAQLPYFLGAQVGALYSDFG